MIEQIHKYFPSMTVRQQEQMAMLKPLYEDWNSKINVISRRDIDNIYTHHVLHSLAIAHEVKFKSGTSVLDFGTGGGFPGIPLAIMFPETQFKLIDRTGKKIRVVNEVAQALGLKNTIAEQVSGEEEKGKYDFVVSRAVMPLPDLVKIVRKNISNKQKNSVANGVFCLKGGNVEGEIQPFRKFTDVMSIAKMFDDEWFKEKYLIYVAL